MLVTRAARIIVLLLAGAVPSAQTPTPAPQKTPVFRSSITVVPLTVTVLDAKGAPVTNLRQADFTVIENGKPREIVNFFPQAFESGSAAVPTRATAGSGIVPQTNRTFLIVLGYGRIQVPARAVDGAIDFVRKHLLPQDAVALMAFHRTTDFTTDHEQIAQILERYKKDHEKIVLEINQYRVMSRNPYSGPAAGGPPIPDKFLKRIDAIFLGTDPGSGPGSKDAGLHSKDPGLQAKDAPIGIRSISGLLLGMDRVVPVIDKPGQQQETLAELKQDLSDTGNDLTDAVLLSTRNKFYAGVEYLRYLDGEKHMLVLGAAIARNVDDAKVLAKRATDARVVVNVVSTAGTLFRAVRPPASDLAELTGGYYTSLEMASKAVAKIDQATRFTYLLGYTPSSPTLDGRYRDVEVKVNRPGVTVRYSHGYFAAATPTPLELKDMIVKSRVEAALAFDSVAADIKITLAASMLPRMGIQSQARVEVVIDASQLGFETKNGRRTASVELQAYCGDAKQNVIGEFGERLDFEADEATYQQWMQTGIRRVVRVPVIESPKFVKVVVYDYGSGRAGSAMITIK